MGRGIESRRGGRLLWALSALLGLATIAFATWFTRTVPATGCTGTPRPGVSSLIAFQMARTPADIEAVFGAAGDPCRAGMVAALDRANRVDLVGFIATYGGFLATGLLALARSGGGAAARLGLVALAVGLGLDVLETAAQLRITQALPGSSGLLAALAVGSVGKFAALSIAGICAGLAMLARGGRIGRIAGAACIAGAGLALVGLAYPPALALVSLGTTLVWTVLLAYVVAAALGGDRRRGIGLHTSTMVVAAFLLGGCGGGATSQSVAQAAPRGAAPASLQGTAWKLATLAGAPALAGVSSTMSFGPQGALSGSDGCNRYRGTYAATGGSLTLTPGGATMMACPEPVMTQAAAFTKAMAATRTSTMDGAQLVLTGAGGERLATLIPLPTASLRDTPWSATGVNNGKQALVSLAQGSEITATFGGDGTLSGNAGCNQYTARYTTTDGDGITISPAATTRKMCPAPVMEQERQYLAALVKATTYRLGEDRLELRDGAGAMQATYRTTR